MPVIFKHNERILCEYSDYQGMYEIRETISLLSFEKDIPENEITFEVTQ